MRCYQILLGRHFVLSDSNFTTAPAEVAPLTFRRLRFIGCLSLTDLVNTTRTAILPVVSLFGECVHPTVELSHITDGSHIVSVLGLGLLRHELPGDVDGGGRLVVGAGRHLEDDLHVVGGAGATVSLVELMPGAGGDEVVVLTGVELQAAGARTE